MSLFPDDGFGSAQKRTVSQGSRASLRVDFSVITYAGTLLLKHLCRMDGSTLCSGDARLATGFKRYTSISCGRCQYYVMGAVLKHGKTIIRCGASEGLTSSLKRQRSQAEAYAGMWRHSTIFF